MIAISKVKNLNSKKSKAVCSANHLIGMVNLMRGWIRYGDGGAKSSYWLGTLGWLLNKRLDDLFLAKRFLASEAGVFRCGSARFGLLLVVFSGFVQSPLQAALTWNYFTTDGVDSISGTFVSDNTSADLGWDGIEDPLINIVVTEFTSWELNGSEVSMNPAPSSPQVGTDSFTWDRSSGGVSGIESFLLYGLDSRVLPPSGHAIIQSTIRLSFPEYTGNPDDPSALTEARSGLSGPGDYGAEPSLIPDPMVSFTPNQTSISPVPEPGEWGLIFGLGTLVVVGVRRRMGHGLCGVR